MRSYLKLCRAVSCSAGVINRSLAFSCLHRHFSRLQNLVFNFSVCLSLRLSSLGSHQHRWMERLKSASSSNSQVDATSAKTLVATVVGLILIGNVGYSVTCQAIHYDIPVTDAVKCIRPKHQSAHTALRSDPAPVWSVETEWNPSVYAWYQHLK